MKNKLVSDWSTELDEYFEEKYGIDINEVLRDEIQNEIQKAVRNENQKDEEKPK